MLQLFAIGQPIDSLRYQQAMQRIRQAINNGSADVIYVEAASSFRAKMTQDQFATGINKDIGRAIANCY